MPTRQRLQARADAARIIDLKEAGPRAGYASESLRKMWFDLPPTERPPLFKRRGRWFVRVDELDAWIAQRDGQVAS